VEMRMGNTFFFWAHGWGTGKEESPGRPEENFFIFYIYFSRFFRK
jgi:hypothetical protein